ncbi:MAG: HNH endonuclease [Muribaculaceae bacterium]
MMEFVDWLHANTHLADSSIDKYNRAVKTTSKEMMQLGIIDKPITEMETFELEMAIALISFNEKFLAKDKRGNRMYSNSLKQFKYYFITSQETSNTVEQAFINKINSDASLSVTTRESIINSRIGQGVFRHRLLEKYKKCIITGVDNQKLLIASHIKPWALSNNSERLSEDNGFLLTPTFDKLFDIGLITFNMNSTMRISQFLGKENEKRLNIQASTTYDLMLNQETIKNLQYHNDVIFVK